MEKNIASSSLTIEINPKQAFYNAVTIGVIGGAFLLVWVYVAVFEASAPSGMVTNILLSLMLLWIFATLFHCSYWQFKLSRFEGPYFVLNCDGIIDYSRAKRQQITWAEIRQIRWYSHYSSPVKILKIKLRHYSFIQRISHLFGVTRLNLPAQNLSVSTKEISDFLKKHAPKEILKF